MPNIGADEIITMKHTRHFTQPGGPGPTNRLFYAGQDSQYLKVEGVSDPENGDITPIFVHDPTRVGGFRMVARTKVAPDLPEATLVFLEKHGATPRHLLRMGCMNVYELMGACGDLSNFDGGWTDYILIYSGGESVGRDLGDRSAWGDSDDQHETSVNMRWSSIYPVGGISFGEKAAAEVSREVIDVTYGNPPDCDTCGDPSAAIQWAYAVTASSGSGSPGLPAELIYSVDGGDTIRSTNIDEFGANENPIAIDIVGNYLVVLGLGAYYYATINQQTGVPGAFTKVSTGFNASGFPRDMYALSSHDVFFVGVGGYIYYTDDIPSGVRAISEAGITSNNLYRIHGNGDTIIITGAASTVLKSVNRGASFSTTATNPSAIPLDIKAVAVKNATEYWVGTLASGRVYYTRDGGETWTQKNFPGAGSGGIFDILFVTEEIGFISYATTAPDGRILSTCNGGYTWAASSDMSTKRLLNLPVNDRINRLAAPRSSDLGTASNYLLAGGLAGDGSDGVLLFGFGNIV